MLNPMEYSASDGSTKITLSIRLGAHRNAGRAQRGGRRGPVPHAGQVEGENVNTPRRLGSTGPTVFPLALGCMGMSGMYGPADEKTGLATIHAALESGVPLFDTGDFYGMGHNEMLLGR